MGVGEAVLRLRFTLKETEFSPMEQHPHRRPSPRTTQPQPARSAVLTFDDGQKGFLNYGIPLLEQYEVPATSFIICSQDSTPEKLRDYASPYVSFQSHSYNMHRDGSDGGRGGEQ